MRGLWIVNIFLGLLILIYIGFGGIMDWQLTHIAGIVENIHDHPLTVTRSALMASRDLTAIGRELRQAVLLKDKEEQKDHFSQIELLEIDAKKNLNVVNERILGEQGQSMAKQAIELINQWQPIRNEITDSLQRGDRNKAIMVMTKKGSIHMSKVDDMMNKITNYAGAMSMRFHVDSQQQLKRAKIVLLSAGLIIVILSVVFGFFVGRWFLRSLANTKKTLAKIKQMPIDLSTKFPTPSVGQINEELNGLLSALQKSFMELKDQALSLKGELAEWHEHYQQLPTKVDKISDDQAPVYESLRELSKQQLQQGHSHKLLLDALTQVRGDLILLSQVSSSQDIIIDQLRIEKDLPKDAVQKMVDKLHEHGNSLRDNLDRSSRSIGNISSLLEGLARNTSELLSICERQAQIGNEIPSLKEMASAYDKRLSTIRVTAKKLDDALSHIKLA